MRDWMMTSTGKRFYMLDPRVEDIDILDIARGLAMTCRYGGQTKRHYYSVAEHSVLCSRHCDPRYAREALLHDASEAYIGDMVRPLKYQPEMSGFREAESRLERVVEEHFKLQTTPEARAAIKTIDDRILVDEIWALMAAPELYLEPGSFLGGLEPLNAEIMSYSPERAEVLFLARFGELFPEFAGAVRVQLT